jgi:hypothetical protein
VIDNHRRWITKYISEVAMKRRFRGWRRVLYVICLVVTVLQPHQERYGKLAIEAQFIQQRLNKSRTLFGLIKLYEPKQKDVVSMAL